MRNKKAIIASICIALTLIVVGVLGVWIHNRKKDRDVSGEDSNKNDYSESSEEYVDAEQFYKDYSEEVTMIDATNPDRMLDERSAYCLLNERGLGGSYITAAYTEDGVYYGETEIRPDLEYKHPVYQTKYMSENGDEWLIMIIGKNVMACPVTFVSLPGEDIPIVVSETKTVTGYDNISGRFYETVPKENVLKIVQVEVVNAATLDSIAEEANHNLE